MNILVVSVFDRRLSTANCGLRLLHFLAVDEHLLLELRIICQALDLLNIAHLLLRSIGVVLRKLTV